MMMATRVISSMATRPMLEELLERYRAASGARVSLESVGGVEASRRLMDGEPFDAAILAAGAIDRLVEAGKIEAASRVDLARSAVAVAVSAGSPAPDISTADALRRGVIAAPSIGYSTGPSGAALAALFERWGIADEIAARLRVPPPGVPVGLLLQRGEVQLGFQQLSELMHLDGIEVLGLLPAPIAIETIFAGGVCAVAARREQAGRLLDFLGRAETAECKRRHGMEAI